jgi:predicted ester cyclase
MAEQQYETVLHRWFEEVWNQKREEVIDELLEEGTVLNGLNDAEGNPLCGREGFKTMHRAFLSAFPDLQVTIEDTVKDGDKIAVRCSVRATHGGDGLGITPKNQTVEFTGLGIARIKDGKIVEVWNEFDFMKMYAQLGALSLNFQ